MKKQKTAIVPTRDENFPEWYQQVVKASDFAEHSPVRGCMVIKPWGYAVWENIQRVLDRKFKDLGHENAYFPLFIPLSYFQKEAKHVEGFAKECAVVTHHRLEPGKDGDLVPAGELEEPLVVRPTSEMVIGEMFSKWIESYRDLPLKINQWANVVRWEMRTRLFLRTAEFLWQEGHTAHATKEEADSHARLMLRVYADFAADYLAMPLIQGEKSEAERFPGADVTYCIEAMMQDGKALQAGTSHFLGQNFSKAADIVYTTKEGKEEFAWTTSWGVTTRFIGAMIMMHGDDDGMVLPPRIASSHIVIVPVVHDEEAKEAIEGYVDSLAGALRQITYFGAPLSVRIDSRDIRGGEKNWEWIKKGVPIRIEVGKRELEADTLFVKKRIRSPKEAEKIPRETFLSTVCDQLDEIHTHMYNKNEQFLQEHLVKIDSKEAFYEFFSSGKPGFVLSHFAGDTQVEEEIKKDLSVTVRCIPHHLDDGEGTCPFTGKPSQKRLVFAKAY